MKNPTGLLITIVTLIGWGFAPHAASAQTNLIANGSFEQAAGVMPANWNTTNDPNNGVKHTIALDAGRTSGKSVKIDCTSFPPPSQMTSTSHADLSQRGFTLTAGSMYQLTFWMKGQNIDGGTMRVSIFDTSTWAYCPLWQYLTLNDQWQQFQFTFLVTKNVSTPNALLWFTLDEVGTVWIDDVELVQKPSEPPRRNPRVPAIGAKNLLPNASFEAGPDGWSSLGKVTGWGGDLCGLYGGIVADGAWEGTRCLRVELGPGLTPVTYYDVWPMDRKAQNAPLAANLGWIDATPGQSYTLSAYLRANRAGVPAQLVFCHGPDPSQGAMPWRQVKNITLTDQWSRYSFTVNATQKDIFVALGPSLASENETAVIWIDAVQLEQGPVATGFARRELVEVGLDSGKFGNIFNLADDASFRLTCVNDSDQAITFNIQREITDYFGNRVSSLEKSLHAPARSTQTTEWPLNLSDLGYYRVKFDWQYAGHTHERTFRMAIIDSYAGDDSPFGINHAPTTEAACKALRQAGLLWARDWSVNWGLLEPEKGQLDFMPADQQMDRYQMARLKILALMPPLPASDWASSAPSSVEAQTWARMAYMPTNRLLLMDFIQKSIRHYTGKVNYWEFLNEPVWTSFCLPSSAYNLPEANYTPADYIGLLKDAYLAMKAADPACKVIGGFSAEPWRYMDEFINADGLKSVDILNIHNYGGMKAPETYIAEMDTLLSKMDQREARRPIWITEYSYYAADDLPWSPWIAPPNHWSANLLLKDERRCADWSIRYNAIMFAHGVEKIFYHQGAEGEVNNGSWNLELAHLGEEGEPRKLYAAQAVMARMLGPQFTYAAPLKKTSVADGHSTNNIYGYAFQCADRAVLIAWITEGESSSFPWALNIPSQVESSNIMGKPLPGRQIRLDNSPAYFVSRSMSAAELAQACTLGSYKAGLKKMRWWLFSDMSFGDANDRNRSPQRGHPEVGLSRCPSPSESAAKG